MGSLLVGTTKEEKKKEIPPERNNFEAIIAPTYDHTLFYRKE
jgi:hypothetical protein